MNAPIVQLQGQDARTVHRKLCRALHDAIYGFANAIAAEAGIRPAILRAFGDIERCENEQRRQPFYSAWRILYALIVVRGERGRLSGIELLRPLAALVGCRLVADDALAHKRLQDELCDAIQAGDRGEIETIRRGADGELSAADAEVIRQRAAEASLEWSEVANAAAEVAANGAAR